MSSFSGMNKLNLEVGCKSPFESSYFFGKIPKTCFGSTGIVLVLYLELSTHLRRDRLKFVLRRIEFPFYVADWVFSLALGDF